MRFRKMKTYCAVSGFMLQEGDILIIGDECTSGYLDMLEPASEPIDPPDFQTLAGNLSIPIPPDHQDFFTVVRDGGLVLTVIKQKGGTA